MRQRMGPAIHITQGVSMFDSLLNEVASRFGISLDKAKLLLGSLIALIFNEKSGGVGGFVDRFRSLGLGGMVDSWIGDSPNEPISASQLEQVLGNQNIDDIAHRTGVDRSTAASAMAALLPGAFNTLTEGGRIPTGIPERISVFMDGLGDFFVNIGTGALGLGAAAVGGVAQAAGRAGDAVGNVASGAADAIGDAGRAAARTVDRTTDAVGDAARKASGGIGKWLPWLLLAGLLIAALFWFKGCSKHETTPAPTSAATAAPASTAQTAQRFGFSNTDGKVTVNGQVATEAEKTRLWDALVANFGAGNVNGDIVVDANTAPAGWLDKLIALLPDLKASGLKFDFDGDSLKIDTSALSEADRFALSQKFRGAFSGFDITGMWDQAMAALAGLKPGYDADQLVKALNLMDIFFATGSAAITKDSNETLQAAAKAIQGAPAGIRIQAGGHTDNTGDAAANMVLSQQRADAVVARLKELGVADGVLTAKGYGQEDPIADNNTEEGRALNRRMAFTVLN